MHRDFAVLQFWTDESAPPNKVLTQRNVASTFLLKSLPKLFFGSLF